MTTVITVEHDGDQLWWSLQELTTSTQLAPEFVVQCVECGVMEASGPQVQWRFDVDARQRLQRAWRLHRDLELHVSALPIVIDLLEEMENLREEAHRLRGRLQHWEFRE
jgi:hypothetical protein